MAEDKKIIERAKYSRFPCPLYRGRFQGEPGGNNIADNHWKIYYVSER